MTLSISRIMRDEETPSVVNSDVYHIAELPTPPKPRGTLRNSGEVQKIILLAEDSRMTRVLVAELLANQRYTILSAEDGPDALGIALHGGYRKIDLLLTDIVMPLMSGMELSRHIKAIHPETRVLYMSAFLNDDDARECVRDNGALFIPKPFTAELLTKTVRRALVS